MIYKEKGYLTTAKILLLEKTEMQSQQDIYKMQFLEKFTPAENYLLLENSKATMKGLLKLTMLDLLVKGVISTENVVVRADERSRERILIYVQAGINFQSYQPKAHEAIFLDIFQANPDNKVLFKHLVKYSYDNAKSIRNLVHNQILTHSEITNLFSTRKMFGVVELNDSGRLAKIQLQKELDYLQSSCIDDHSLLKRVNGNLFLMNIVDSDFPTEIDQELDNKESETSSTAKSGFSSYQIYFNAFTSDFDNSFDSAASSSSGFWFGDWGSDSLTG